uniref:Uncharacterized protein n=1 Tax=Oryzias latipes TaxID=8090 RepID=A0A3P9H3E1_ORYLA
TQLLIYICLQLMYEICGAFCGALFPDRFKKHRFGTFWQLKIRLFSVESAFRGSVSVKRSFIKSSETVD